MIETWTCHMCGKEKSDADISVLSFELKNFRGAWRNIRYCKHNPECLKKAQDKQAEQKI